MKQLISILLVMKTVIFLAIIAFAAADSEYYGLEKIDVDELVKNTDEFNRFVDCVLDRAECRKLYSTYKAITAEAVEQICKKCSPYQKHSFWLFLQGLTAKLPDDYINFRHKYDPENKYFDALESELKKYSIEY